MTQRGVSLPGQDVLVRRTIVITTMMAIFLATLTSGAGSRAAASPRQATSGTGITSCRTGTMPGQVAWQRLALRLSDLERGTRRTAHRCSISAHGEEWYRATFQRAMPTVNWLVIDLAIYAEPLRQAYPTYAYLLHQATNCRQSPYCRVWFYWQGRLGTASAAFAVFIDGAGTMEALLRRGSYVVALTIVPLRPDRVRLLQTLTRHLDWRIQHYGCTRVYRCH